jgi:protein-S-isoprenylcysteine O-methyltransferase Ste14
MMIKNPKLLASRLDGKEKVKQQGIVIKLSGLMFISIFIVSGLDYRFKWFVIHPIVTYIACGVFLLSYVMFAVVLTQNTYLSRTIKVETDQTVIDTGLYSIIRHPMYTATIFLFLSMPLILGSLISFFVFLLYPVLIIIRILNEEKYLTNNLQGYKDYKEKVKYRLIPFIW